MEFKAIAVIDTEAMNKEFMVLIEKLQNDMVEVMKKYTTITSQYVDVENPKPDGQA